MSFTQTKEKNRCGKLGGYYGRLPGGYMSNQCSEMTRDETITLARLHKFLPCDYESYRARGEEFRHRLSGAVLHALKLSMAFTTWRLSARAKKAASERHSEST